MRKLFGTDGIRGMANKFPMTLDVCRKFARALVAFNLNRAISSTSSTPIVIIGKDTRISCDTFENTLAEQFASLGVCVKLVGVCPTPAISVLTKTIGADFGIMISASHNPYWDNGIKTFKSDGLKLTDKEEIEIEAIIESDDHFSPGITKDGSGSILFEPFLINTYLDRMKSAFSFSRNNNYSIKIVVDSSNGSFSKIAPEMLRYFGFDVISINDSPNGTNINDNCGIMHPKVIAAATLEHKADVGIAFDGDGDRILLCDENGRFLDGDHILAVLIEATKSQPDAPHFSEIASTIMANFGFEEYLQNLGIKLARTSVGDRYISEYMQKSPQILFGGEPSGHVIIREHALSGDGLFTALKVLDYLVKSGRKLSELRDIFTSYPVISYNAKVKEGVDKHSLLANKHIADLVFKYEQQLLNRGKLIVRPSGTEPIIRISVEGKNEDELRAIISDISEAIELAQK